MDSPEWQMPFVEELSHPFVPEPMIAKIIGDRTESIRKSYLPRMPGVSETG
jgi:hypothetical protein